MALKVNGVEISGAAVRFELDRLVKFYSEYMSPEQIKAQMGLLRKKACEQAIGARLLVEEANRLNVPVPADDIETRLKTMVDQAGGEAAFNRLLQKQNLTRDMLRKSIEQGRRVDMLVERIAAGAPAPEEAEILAHYEAHRKEYRKADLVQARHILVKPDSKSRQDRQVAMSKIAEIRKRIADGAEFADQAAAFSDCPSGRKTGGSLGWLSRGMTVPAFDAAVFSMQVGQLSEVIETPLGLHIIQKTAAEAGGDMRLDEARDKIREFLMHAARGEAISAYVADLKKKAVIEEE